MGERKPEGGAKPTPGKRGRALEAERRWAEAAEQYRAAVQRRPGKATWWYRLGRMLQREHDAIGAAQAYRMAITLSGGSARQYFRLGAVLESTGQVAEARVAYQHAERLGDPPLSLDGERGRALPYRRRIDLNLPVKAEYAYLTLRAASLAQKLGVERISVLELGVAGGNGLVALEQHACDVEALTGVGIEVYGFDTGEGLHAPEDHRDLPYYFAEGNYAIDLEALRGRLQRARLVLGDAAQTLPRFLAGDDHDPAPVGAIAFDMDLYAATRAALAALGEQAPEGRFLPRISAYFDDVVGKKGQDYNEFTGELLAIREFNEASSKVKVAEDRYFRALPLNYPWHHGVYMLHRFGHPDYATYISGSGPQSLALKA